MRSSRREFVVGMGLAATGLATRSLHAQTAACPFRLSVINDEISPDFDHACDVAANEFGLHWIELRSMWGKTVTSLDADDIAKSKAILDKYKLKVTDIGSPLFKADWPGAPISKESPTARRKDAGAPEKDVLHEQDVLLDKCIETAKAFGTDRIRCFDFWRLEDPKPYRAAINAKLAEAAEKCAKHGMILLLENEMACNTGSGEEAIAVLKAVPNKNFMLNWDPGNAATFAGNTPYPDAYNMIPKGRIGHCHCKDTVRHDGAKSEWAPVGGGIIDWVGQFKAFVHDGYHYGVSLETHWHKAGSTKEESTRISMKGLKDTLAKAGISC